MSPNGGDPKTDGEKAPFLVCVGWSSSRAPGCGENPIPRAKPSRTKLPPPRNALRRPTALALPAAVRYSSANQLGLWRPAKMHYLPKHDSVCRPRNLTAQRRASPVGDPVESGFPQPNLSCVGLQVLDRKSRAPEHSPIVAQPRPRNATPRVVDRTRPPPRWANHRQTTPHLSLTGGSLGRSNGFREQSRHTYQTTQDLANVDRNRTATTWPGHWAISFVIVVFNCGTPENDPLESKKSKSKTPAANGSPPKQPISQPSIT